MSSDLGDFQTPPDLVDKIFKCLTANGESWSRFFEPTCGTGNFIVGLSKLPKPPSEIQALELQSNYVSKARERVRFSSLAATIEQTNVFDCDFRELNWREASPLLVLGNPPWVTNSGLGVLNSDNLPQKTNFKRLQGLEAMTGRSNFDIAEYIWLRLITELAKEKPTIALLCKTSVARNVLQYAFDADLPISRASMWRIDAKKWFGVAVDACLFRVDVGPNKQQYEAEIYSDLENDKPHSIMGVVGGKFVSDTEAYRRTRFADGVCSLTWRQGVKHDAASVLELKEDAGSLRNKSGEFVSVEPNYVYPLIKGSDLFHGNTDTNKSVILTQNRLGDDTKHLEYTAPKLWWYLTQHSHAFDNRKSSIYRGKPRFALFGLGDYTFASYKVAVSGLHKEARFRAIGPREGRPVAFDATCYLLPCASAEQASLLCSLLSDPLCKDLIHSMIFWDSKRPVTKRLLQRIDLGALLKRVSHRALLSRAEEELVKLVPPQKGKAITWPTNLEELMFGSPLALESGQPTLM